jgi:hypothetical protein
MAPQADSLYVRRTCFPSDFLKQVAGFSLFDSRGKVLYFPLGVFDPVLVLSSCSEI